MSSRARYEHEWWYRRWKLNELDAAKITGPAEVPILKVLEATKGLAGKIESESSPSFQGRELLISVVDSDQVNAAAYGDIVADHVWFHRGLFERVFGLANA